MKLDWESRFQAADTPWRRNKTNPALIQWLDMGLLKPCRILIPGCGNCLEVLDLARLGFEVTGLDMSATALAQQEAILKKAGLKAELIEADLFDWSSKQAFDAIYEQTCLCAIEPRERLAYEAKLRAWLRPEGRLFALFMQTGKRGGPPYDCPLEDMKALFSDRHWRWSLQSFAVSHMHAIKGLEVPHLLEKRG